MYTYIYIYLCVCLCVYTWDLVGVLWVQELKTTRNVQIPNFDQVRFADATPRYSMPDEYFSIHPNWTRGHLAQDEYRWIMEMPLMIWFCLDL